MKQQKTTLETLTFYLLLAIALLMAWGLIEGLLFVWTLSTWEGMA